MRFKYLTILTIAVALVGCSTSSISVSKAKYVAPNRVYGYQQPKEASLTIVRDTGITGSGCNASIFINGQISAKLKPGEKVTFHLDKGEWIVGTSIESSGLCAFNPSRMERAIKLGNGDNKTYRVFTTWDGTMDILPTTF